MGRSHRYRAALLSANKAGAYTAMPIFAYFAVAGSVLIALLFVADATLEKGTPAVVTSQNGLPKHPVVTSDQYDGLEKPWRPKTQKQILAAAPAPAPDMTSPLVLAAQPASAFEAVTPAREARAEAPPKKVRVEVSAKKARAEAPPQNQRITQPSHYQQTTLYDRFSIRGY
jgi:hypothetical protein